jgi:hypothetical protein
MTKLVQYFCFFILISNIAFGNTNARNVIEKYDISFYHPEVFGLKDLVFDARISNLTEALQKEGVFQNVKDIFYRVYWAYPGKYKIEVKGLPQGFNKRKEKLASLINSKLEFVIPDKLSNKLRSYSLKIADNQNKKLTIKGNDRSGSRDVSELVLEFNKEGKLNKYTAVSPSGSKESTIDLKIRSWSHNKWVLEKQITKFHSAYFTSIIENKIEYLAINGHGFPKNIITNAYQELRMDPKLLAKSIKEKKIKSNKSKVVTSEIIFSNYKVNSGKALKAIMQVVKGINKINEK